MKTYTDEAIAKVREALKLGIQQINMYGSGLACVPLHEAVVLLDNPVAQEPVAYLVRDPVMGRAIYFDVEIAKKYMDNPIPLYTEPHEKK